MSESVGMSPYLIEARGVRPRLYWFDWEVTPTGSQFGRARSAAVANKEGERERERERERVSERERERERERESD